MQTSVGSYGQAGAPWEEASPPWQQPGWDDTGNSRPGLDRPDLTGKHPSDPLPSLPPQPPHAGYWPEAPLSGYAGHQTGGRHAAGYTGGQDDGIGYGYATGYHPGRYQETDHRPGYDDTDTGTGYPVTGDVPPAWVGGFTDTTTGFTDTTTGFPVTGDVPPASAGSYADTGAGFTDTATGFPVMGDVPPASAGSYADTGAGFADTGAGYPVTDDVPPAGVGGFTATTNGFPVTGDVPPAGAGGFADTGAGFADTGAGFAGTGPGLADTGAGFTGTGTGYVDPAYGDDRFSDDERRYPEDGGYQAGDDEYPEYHGSATGRRDQYSGHDYPDTGSWYGDVDEQRGWVEHDDSGFLPGMGRDDPDDDGGQGDGQAPGRGRRPGSAGPGKQKKTAKTKAGKARGGKPKSRMRRVAPWLALSVVLALLIGAAGGYYYVYSHYLHPPDFSGPGTGAVVVRIFPGDTASVVGERLQKEGVVASARAFSNAAKVSGQGTALEPGYYRVRLHMSAALAFALLLKPSSRVQTKIIVPEGWRLSEIIAVLGRATGNPAGYRRAIKNTGALGLPSFAHGNPEGYLFPATYDVQPNTPPLKVLQQMVARFGQEATSIHLPAAAAHARLTQADVITIASLIQAEGRPKDFPKVARVIYNRLNATPPIKLQLDSTVMYALHTHGIRASAQQIKVKSPYNTYVHTGLPPGPIDSPGDAAIQAALHPAHGTWMYFVTVDPKTGLTKFTSSFAQFQRYEAELTANLAKGR